MPITSTGVCIPEYEMEAVIKSGMGAYQRMLESKVQYPADFAAEIHARHEKAMDFARTLESWRKSFQ